MGKRGGHHPVPGYFTLQGAQVEDRDTARGAKAALGREAARRQRRAGRKTKLGEAPKEQRTKEPPKPGTPPSSKVLAAAHDRELAAKTARKAPAARKATTEARKPATAARTATEARKPATPARTAMAEPRSSAPARRMSQPNERTEAKEHQPRYLTDAARGLVRRVARVAFAPVALARAVVDRFRDRD